MGKDIPGAQAFHKQLFDRQGRKITAKIDHYGNIGGNTGFQGFVNRRPFRAFVMSYFYSYHIITILPGDKTRHLSIHVLRILLIGPAPHSFPYNIKEGQHPCL